MKAQLVLAVLLIIGLSHSAMAQQQNQPQEETVVIKKSDLTADQLAKVQGDQIKEKLTQYSEYADMGRGIGLAVGESLRSVKDVAIDFSRTEVGKFTLFLIAWKVMAKDVIDMGDKVVGYIIGPPTFLIGGVVLVWSYRRQCLPRRVLVEKSKEGKKWAIIAPNGQPIELKDDYGRKTGEVNGRGGWALGHVAVGLVLFIFASFLTFGC